MRVVAGILMIIGAVLGFTLVRAVFLQPPASLVPFEGLLKWLSTFWAIFVGIGGGYTLKGKAYGLCLALSILCIPLGILPFLSWGAIHGSGENINIPFAIMITLVFLAIGFLPVISVKLRKREWQS